MSLFRILTGRFYPKDEDFGDVVHIILFNLMWIAISVKQFLEKSLEVSTAIGLVLVMVMFKASLQMIKEVMACRGKRKEAMRSGTVQEGKIVGVQKRQEKQKLRRGMRIVTYYKYEVEITCPQTGVTTIITSGEYQQAVHCWISSPNVRVYTDKSGWNHYLSNFDVKGFRKEPFLPEEPQLLLGVDEILDFVFIKTSTEYPYPL